MRKDDDLIRKVLEHAEEHADGGVTVCRPQSSKQHSAQALDYHIVLASSAGWLEIEDWGTLEPDNPSTGQTVRRHSMTHLTLAGHDELARRRAG